MAEWTFNDEEFNELMDKWYEHGKKDTKQHIIEIIEEELKIIEKPFVALDDCDAKHYLLEEQVKESVLLKVLKKIKEKEDKTNEKN